MPKMSNPKTSYKQVQRLGGKAAVFVRGVMLFDESNKLRDHQEAGLAAVRELGEEISIPYVSKLTALMGAAGILDKERKGRSFTVSPGVAYDDFTKWIDENFEWGTSIEDLPDDQTILERSTFLDQINHDGAVRLSNDHPLGKSAYSLAREKFATGEYDMVFIKREWDVMAVHPNHQTEHEVTYISSVSDQ